MDSIAHLDKLANVPEIFEEVFFKLPFLDLVIATGVNHTWRDFIYNSAKLQRKLFRSPSKALVGEPYVDKHGVLGRRMNQKECLNDDNNTWTADLCPFLLAPKFGHHSAYLTERAAQATFWPYMYLTNPPCAHARVSFTYKGILENDTLVVVEGARSLYRLDGVTIVAIEEALYQPGAAQVKKVVRNGQHMPEVVWTKQQYNTTLLEEIAACEEKFNCKLDIDLAETWIRLHCSTSEPAGALRVVIPYRFSHMRYALPARKILFDE